MHIQQDYPWKTVPDFSGLNTDSFSRLRVSSPSYVFDAQMTYDLQPLLMEQLTANGGGGTATIVHDATNRCATMTATAAQTGGYAYMQSFQYFPYQPGRSQLVFCTFNMREKVVGVTKFAGYSDGVNGFEFQVFGNDLRFVIYSSSTAGTEIEVQGQWNIDKMNGLGGESNPSGFFLDITKTQILVIDFQALYVGRVRMGFDIDGQVVWAHEFLHANKIVNPYIATANLPMRCGMSWTATVTTTMDFICSAVISEGGDAANIMGYNFTQEGTVTAASGARTHLLSLQRKTTFNSITNRTKFVVESLQILVTGNNPVLWEICLGDVITGTTTFNDVNATYSGTQYNTAGTTSGTPAIVVASGYIDAMKSGSTTSLSPLSLKYPTALSAAGAVRPMGRYTLLVTGIGGSSACRGFITWREIR